MQLPAFERGVVEIYRESDLQHALQRQHELSREPEQDRTIRLSLVAQRRGHDRRNRAVRRGRARARLAGGLKAALALGFSIILAVVVLVSQAG